MGEKAKNIIDLTINKKLHSSFITKCTRSQLFQFTRTSSNPNNRLSKILEPRAFNIKEDLYNNKIYNLLAQDIPKSQNKFNLLRLFKPGEILNSVIRH